MRCSVVAVNIYVFLSSKVQSSTYLVSTDPSASYSCPSISNEQDCHIYCDKREHWNTNTYNCNNAFNCHFHCDEKECAWQSILNATDASNLYVTEDSSGELYFSEATITTPNDGNAYFDTHSKKGFNSLTVHAGRPQEVQNEKFQWISIDFKFTLIFPMHCRTHFGYYIHS
eukprot:219504_1